MHFQSSVLHHKCEEHLDSKRTSSRHLVCQTGGLFSQEETVTPIRENYYNVRLKMYST